MRLKLKNLQINTAKELWWLAAKCKSTIKKKNKSAQAQPLNQRGFDQYSLYGVIAISLFVVCFFDSASLSKSWSIALIPTADLQTQLFI